MSFVSFLIFSQVSLSLSVSVEIYRLDSGQVDRKLAATQAVVQVHKDFVCTEQKFQITGPLQN